jgi:hypothetical protein
MNKFMEMDYDVWVETYKPILNHIDTNASFDGMMFETYDEEYAFVKATDENRIWMYGDGDDGGSYIWSGWGFVNRIGYFITEVPFPEDTTIQIRVSFNWFYCENCSAEFEDPDNTIRDAFDEADLQKCPECATLEEMTLVGLENPMQENQEIKDEEETVFHSFSNRTVQI